MIPLEVLAALPEAVRARRELKPALWAAYEQGGRTNELEPGVREAARVAYLGTWSRNEQFVALATRILDGARAHGLTLLPLKGAVLAPLLWGDVGARPMADLDLAVLPKDLERACELLAASGLVRTYPERARFSPRHGHDVAFLDENKLTVELHYRLTHELAGDASFEPVFARAIEVELFARKRAVPAWDDQLWMVAVHAATHAFGDSPLWPLDLWLLVEHGASVERAARAAEARRFGVAFRAALRVAERVLGRELGAQGARPGDGVRARLLAAVLGAEPLARPPSQLASLLSRALLTERARDAARELVRKVELRAVEWGEARSRTGGRPAGT